MSTRLAGGLALLILGISASLAAQETPAPKPAPTVIVGATDPGTTVDFEPLAGRFDEPLPFDVPFWIRWPRPADLRQADAWYSEAETLTNCLGLTPNEHTSLGPGAPIQDAKGTAFLLPVPALAPGRYYCFGFRRPLTQTELVALRKQVAEVIDQTVRTEVGEDQQASEFERLRQRILQQIDIVLPPGQRIDSSSAPFFDPNKKVTFTRYQVGLVAVLDANDAVRGRYADLEEPFGDALSLLAPALRAKLPTLSLSSGTGWDLARVREAEGEVALLQGPNRSSAETGALRDLIDRLADVESALRNRQEKIQAVAAVIEDALSDLAVAASTTASYEVTASWYIGVDLGFGIAPDLNQNETFVYTGFNLYFRPVNKRAPLDWGRFRTPGQRKAEFLRRFALTVGLPTTNLDQPGQRSGIVLDRPLVLGAGFRLNGFLRLSGGGLLFRADNPDPLVNSTDLKLSPFFAVSVDMDVWNKVIKPLVSPLGGGGQKP